MQPNQDGPTPTGDPGQTQEDVLSQAFYRDRNVAEMGKGPGDSRRMIFVRMARYLLPVIVVFVAIDLWVRWAFPPDKLLPYMQKEFAYYTHKVKRCLSLPSPDVLLMGSSRIRDDLNPKVLAAHLEAEWGRPVRVYNYGLGGSHMEEVYTLVSSYMPEPIPKYVILGFSGTEVAWPYHFRYASRFIWKTENFLDYLGRVSFSHFRVRHVEYFIESFLCDYWYLFANRDALCTLLGEKVDEMLGIEQDPIVKHKREEEKKRLVNHVMVEDGYFPVLPRWKDLATRLKNNPRSVKIQNRRELIKDPDVLNDTSADLLRLMVPKLRAMGCKVAIVETPPSPFMQSRNPILHGPGFRNWMKGVAEELDVLFFAFPPKKYGLTNNLYGDASHLSKEGSTRYSRFVFKELRNAGFFEEGRQ
ncbi:MAG: hypothetical protein ACYTG7_17300 [Planctomycetota bacterium]